jgi:hypothetical protein
MDRVALAFEQTIDDVALARRAFARGATTLGVSVKWMLTGAENKAFERHLPSSQY